MTAITYGLLAAIFVVALAVLWTVTRMHRSMSDGPTIDTDQLSSAIGQTWRDLEFDQSVGQLEHHAREMREFHGDITRLLRSPQQRGEFGEQQLDVLLSDHLPQDLYGIRERVVRNKTPDAYIESTSGIICIDSKFPLDNYEAFLDAEGDDERERYRQRFRGDVERQLEKIAEDYVDPDAGTAEFAFAFIPSESVYYHLISEEHDMLRRFTKEGVQVVSPLTLGHKLELIKADVQSRKLSEQAEEILDQLTRLHDRFETVEAEWSTLYQHIRNAKNKADDVDTRYESLRSAFERIEEPTTRDVSTGD